MGLSRRRRVPLAAGPKSALTLPVNPRFPQFFSVVLCVLAALALLPSRAASERWAVSVQSLFAPIAGPLHWLGASGRSPTTLPGEEPIVNGADRSLSRQRENELLRGRLRYLEGQVASLRLRIAESERRASQPGGAGVSVKVIAAEAGGRRALRLLGTEAPIAVGDPARVEDDIVGRVMTVGAGQQAVLRLITDRGVKSTVVLTRFDAEGNRLVVPLDATICEGMGENEMRIEAWRWEEVTVAGVRPGDVVTLHESDADWPAAYHGRTVGIVTAVARRVDATGFAEIRVRPRPDLLALTQVIIDPKTEPQP
jgi:hypothetical protein